jgi:hypothetical protein
MAESIQTLGNITEADVAERAEQAKDLRKANAQATLSGFVVQCTMDSAIASGVRVGKRLAQDTYTDPRVLQARRSGDGPHTVLAAALAAAE